MILGNRPPAVMSPLRSPYPRFSGNMNTVLPGSHPTIKFGQSSTEEKGFLDTAKSWLKLLLPTTLAAGALYQNANIVKYLWGLDNTISKFIADNTKKTLSSSQWLWENVKSFCFSAVAAVPASYYFTRNLTSNNAEHILGRLVQIRNAIPRVDNNIIPELGSNGYARLLSRANTAYHVYGRTYTSLSP